MGLNKLVKDLSNKKDDDNKQETSKMQFEDLALKTNVLAFASRSKAKAKTRRRTPACSSTRIVKSIPPTTENWLRKLYNYSMTNDTSTEDKHETNHINNKCNDMNMNTRKMHNT